jgi:hypothetical protein
MNWPNARRPSALVGLLDGRVEVDTVALVVLRLLENLVGGRRAAVLGEVGISRPLCEAVPSTLRNAGR